MMYLCIDTTEIYIYEEIVYAIYTFELSSLVFVYSKIYKLYHRQAHLPIYTTIPYLSYGKSSKVFKYSAHPSSISPT
jgi:hypothetical protein